MEIVANIPTPEECASQILDYTGHIVEPEAAGDLWLKILQHKWFLSEKLGRDVGIKVACLDFFENSQANLPDFREEEIARILRELGGTLVDRNIWDTISDTQPPKKIVEKRIILPLTKVDLARKHGVVPPKTIIFFGPPGTGKTHFVRAIAGVLKWWYVEVSPSDLMAQGQDRLGSNLKALMEKSARLEEAVIFIDEFEEIAASRDNASRMDKSITNEFLKQVPILKKRGGKILLICATNYIRELDAALLRPGRFDCIIPVGGLDHAGLKTIFDHYLSQTNAGEVDSDRIVSLIPFYTPADIEYLFQKVTHAAFERELTLGRDYQITTDLFLEKIPEVKPSLTDKIIAEFERDCREFTRY